jgi:hypothetical protein
VSCRIVDVLRWQHGIRLATQTYYSLHLSVYQFRFSKTLRHGDVLFFETRLVKMRCCSWTGSRHRVILAKRRRRCDSEQAVGPRIHALHACLDLVISGGSKFAADCIVVQDHASRSWRCSSCFVLSKLGSCTKSFCYSSMNGVAVNLLVALAQLRSSAHLFPPP